MVLKKSRSTKDVLFIDASKCFTKGKNQNLMTDDHIQKIVDAYIKRENVDKFTHIVDFAEIEENDFNLNIPRYVDTFEEEEPIDIVELSKELKNIDAEIKKAERELLAMIGQLAVTEESKDIIEAAMEVFRHEH